MDCGATVRVGPAADVYVARDSSASDHPFETSVPPLYCSQEESVAKKTLDQRVWRCAVCRAVCSGGGTAHRWRGRVL